MARPSRVAGLAPSGARAAGIVYQTSAPWSSVLAVIEDRQEAEHVLDTLGLKITEARRFEFRKTFGE